MDKERKSGMTQKQIQAMSDEELKSLALQKGHRGNASSNAKLAQKELIRRNGSVANHHFKGKWKLSDEL